MNREDALDCLIAPHESEKAARLGEKVNQYVFRVRPQATKRSIALAIKEIFGVEVINVQTLNVKGKPKRNRYRVSKRPGFKKAYVSLAPGQELRYTR